MSGKDYNSSPAHEETDRRGTAGTFQKSEVPA
ncbi:MAG: hypothetical protein Pg6C_06360 [Treponemataceae bacterium]|nr:MAG: hypothetical protein Pg6C_06360 [Treponemataceae bacterium]